ncbi:hypothetical protein [Nocardioides sp. B-3]|uniref:hypothetical protein n=1 Tax=Nocardioides sp. B-3 TaxID=2895565 RepID=UPI00215312CC|nr:hypothetical protein [Nocardioides sp. B-3]UUZ59158.1 hypothetical protein LP418_25055 [Nocardioides sp. B-3]
MPAAAPTEATKKAAKVDVPRLLNKWQLIAVTACVLFAVVTAALQLLGWQANRAAADNTEQLVRVQNIQSTLFRADALATTSFLVGGLEDPAQRAAYDNAIDRVTRQITEAAQAQPADSAVLSALNAAVNRYTTASTQARDNNRQGFPVGAEYLRGASNQLRADALPLIEALTESNSDRAETELSGQRPLTILIIGLVALAVLWWVSTQLAKTFRRRFNVGIAAAFVVVAALTLISAAVSSGREGDNDDLRDGSYRLAVDEATARTAANDAKSNESRRLGAQGSGAVFEEGWQAAASTVTSTASSNTLGLWQTYSALHDEVLALEQSGKYDEAVALATTLDPNGPTAAPDAFDEGSQIVIDRAASDTTDALRSGNSIFPGAGRADAASRARRRRPRHPGHRPAP